MDGCSHAANKARAVNTIVRQTNGGLWGENTDGMGLIRDLTINHGLQLAGKKILLLGAGGAARGVLLPLLTQSPLVLTIANRTYETAIALAKEFAADGPVNSCEWTQLQPPFDLIINATASGLHGTLHALPAQIFTQQTDCYDMVYSKDLTQFLQYAQQQSAGLLMNGLGMLVEQAAESFYIWRGRRPDTSPVLKKLRAHIRS